MSAAEFSRFDALVSHYLDGALEDTDAAELLASLAEPPLAARFLETTRLNSEIAGLLAAPVPDAAMVELVRTDIEKSLAAVPAASGVRLRIAERTQPSAATHPTVSTLHAMSPRRKPMWRALACAAVFLMFAGLATIFVFNRTPRAEALTVASVQGEVRLHGATGEHVPKPGQSWQRGETLKTVGANSAATVTLLDGTRLDFGGNSVAANEPSKHGWRMGLEHGVVQAAVKKQSGRRPFIFRTPEAEAIVVDATLQLVVGGHSTRLEVTEGEVRFRRRHDGTEVAVKAGFFAVVGPNVPLVAQPIHGAPHHTQ